MKRVIAVVAAVAAVVSLPVPALADGPVLRAVSLPFLWPRAELFDVTADGAGGVWVGGVQGRYCVRWADFCVLYSDGNPVVRRRVGSAWKEYPINGWAGQGEIGQIVSGAGETWIAGGPSTRGGPSTYVARFDGSAFQKVAIPDGAIGMLATGPAGTFISHWDLDPGQRLLKRTGDGWTAVTVPGIDNVEDVQGISATDAWAVGSRQDLQIGSIPAVAHFDGVAWTSVPLPPGTGNEWFLKVVPVAGDNVWAITQKHLAHWNGSAWTLIAAPSELADLADLTVDASGIPWVAPAEAAESSQTPYRYRDGNWEMVALPDGAEVHDLAAVPGGVWGVGRQGDGPAAFSG